MSRHKHSLLYAEGGVMQHGALGGCLSCDAAGNAAGVLGEFTETKCSSCNRVLS